MWVAVGLHLFSAIALYALSATGISAVGYLSSGAALLLTILRPAIRGYKYLAQRLTTIRSQFLYPREDILELRNRFTDLESTIRNWENKFNLEDPNSWVALQERQQRAARIELTTLAASVEDVRSTNQAEHTKLARDAESALAKPSKRIAQLTDDGQFLNHVREIIRFFKES